MTRCPGPPDGLGLNPRQIPQLVRPLLCFWVFKLAQARRRAAAALARVAELVAAAAAR